MSKGSSTPENDLGSMRGLIRVARGWSPEPAPGSVVLSLATGSTRTEPVAQSLENSSVTTARSVFSNVFHPYCRNPSRVRRLPTKYLS